MAELSTRVLPEATGAPHTTIVPASWYHDPAIHEREQAAIFQREWIHVGHASRVPDPGDYLTCRIGDQSIILLHGRDGRIRAFHNVCRHRGSELLQGAGSVARIWCRYHGWTYDLDGKLIAARHSEKVPGFDRACWGLREVRLERIAGFLFVNLDPDAPPLAAVYPGLAEDWLTLEPELDRLVHAHTMAYDIACNWKIAVENYLEGYHVLTVHPALYKGFDMDAFVWSIHDHYTSMCTGAKETAGEHAYDWDEAARKDLPSYWVWPMVMFERMPGRPGLFTYNHVPLGPARTLQVVDFYFLDPELDEQDRREIDYVDLVRREDRASLEAVQRGIRSKGWQQGPLMMSPDAAGEWTEEAILHFQNLILRRMEAQAA